MVCLHPTHAQRDFRSFSPIVGAEERKKVVIPIPGASKGDLISQTKEVHAFNPSCMGS
jgi:hypothetical protein